MKQINPVTVGLAVFGLSALSCFADCIPNWFNSTDVGIPPELSGAINSLTISPIHMKGGVDLSVTVTAQTPDFTISEAPCVDDNACPCDNNGFGGNGTGGFSLSLNGDASVSGVSIGPIGITLGGVSVSATLSASASYHVINQSIEFAGTVNRDCSDTTWHYNVTGFADVSSTIDGSASASVTVNGETGTGQATLSGSNTSVGTITISDTSGGGTQAAVLTAGVSSVTVALTYNGNGFSWTVTDVF